MKRTFVTILFLLLVCGCNKVESAPSASSTPAERAAAAPAESAPEQTATFQVTREGFPQKVSFSTPEGWKKNEKAGVPFDLQVKSASESANTGIFLNSRTDYKEGITAEDVARLQSEDLESKRNDWTEVEALKSYQKDGKTIGTVVYSGEKDGEIFYYKFTGIEFESDPDTLVSLLQVSFPDEWDKSEPILTGIAESFQIESSSKES